MCSDEFQMAPHSANQHIRSATYVPSEKSYSAQSFLDAFKLIPVTQKYMHPNVENRRKYTAWFPNILEATQTLLPPLRNDQRQAPRGFPVLSKFS
jgi:hypothetical protein